jgi:hypothetical protein
MVDVDSVFAKVKQSGNNVAVIFTGAPATDVTCTEYLKLLEEVYAKNSKFFILYDARRLGSVPWSQIMKQANFMKEKEDLTRRLMVRAAIVVSSSFARFILKSLFKIRKPAAPLQIFMELDAAKTYLREGKDLSACGDSGDDTKEHNVDGFASEEAMREMYEKELVDGKK